MPSIKNLKKDINYVLGDVIEACYVWELDNPKADNKKSEAIIEEAIATFDTLLDKIHEKNIESKKTHFKAIGTALEVAAGKLIAKVNKL